MMHRVVARRFGPPEHVLTYEPVEMITPEKGCVLVRTHASTINPSDLIPVTGAYRHRTPLPFVPGYDGVGVVTTVGEGVDAAMVGRRVLPLGSAGGWQTWKVVSAEWCVSVPDDLSDEQAALAYVNPLTARLMVQALTPKPGDLIGITTAASTSRRSAPRCRSANDPIADIHPPVHAASMTSLQQLGIAIPIVQAPMAGVATPDLAAVVCEASGLGSIGVGATDAAGAREMITATRARTDRPFNVNLFVHGTAKTDAKREQQWLQALLPIIRSVWRRATKRIADDLH